MPLGRRRSLTAAIALLSIILLGLGASQLSASVSQTRDQITFTHLSSDAASHSDRLRTRLQSKYPGTFTDTATVDGYTFDVSQAYAYNEYCALVPTVTRNGRSVDDYADTNEIRDYSSYSDQSDTENTVQSYGDLTASFADPFYKDNYVYWGTWYGITDCAGTFNQYTLPVDHDAITADLSVPDKIVAGDTMTATVQVTNGWKPLRADLQADLCIDGEFCTTLTKEAVQLPRGTSTVTFAHTPETAGDVSMTLSGPVGLDLAHYPVDGVAVDCSGDGTSQDPATCEQITVGQFTGEDVTAVKTPSEALFDNALVEDVVRLYYERLTWENITRWLFGGPR